MTVRAHHVRPAIHESLWCAVTEQQRWVSGVGDPGITHERVWVCTLKGGMVWLPPPAWPPWLARQHITPKTMNAGCYAASTSQRRRCVRRAGLAPAAAAAGRTSSTMRCRSTYLCSIDSSWIPAVRQSKQSAARSVQRSGRRSDAQRWRTVAVATILLEGTAERSSFSFLSRKAT